MTTPRKTKEPMPPSNETAAAAAIALAEKTHETALALAEAKAKSDMNLAVMTNDISYIKQDIREIKDGIRSFKDDFVTHAEFIEALKPIKNIVYGLVGSILLAVIAAILSLIIK